MSQFSSSSIGRYSGIWLIVVGLFELALAAFFVFMALSVPVAADGMYLTAAVLGITALILLAIGLRVRRSATATDRLLREGVAGQATITGLTQAGMYLNNNPRIKMELLVEPPGRPAYAAQHSEFVPLILLGRLAPGAVLPVRVDPAAPQRVAIDWSAQPAMPIAAQPAGPAAQPASGFASGVDESLAQVQAALAGSGAGVPPTYANAEQGNYTVDQLRAWLRANGVEAQARIDVLEDSGRLVGDERLYTVEMTLLVPGSPPETLGRSAAMVPLTAMHKMHQGMTLPVRVAAENHNLLTVEWEKV
jgi:hypothetical protein